jgi:S-adenosylmethionine-diacylglycerol 3-amino-3-carboxypropyl transferase
MRSLYNFGISQEDERTEARALELGPGDRVLSIASAGDMPLSLLALGAARVDAVDLDRAQLHLLALKRAAVLTLDREQAAAFLGFLPAPPSARRSWLLVVEAALERSELAFWRAHREAVLAGAIWQGRFERYVRRLASVLAPILGPASRELLGCRSLEEQAAFFRRRFDRPLYRAIFRIAFHPTLFARRGMDPRSLAHRSRGGSLGDQYFASFRSLCTATPASENYLLQLMLLGRIVSLAAAPAYLSEEGAARLRARRARLVLHHADLLSYLRALPVQGFDKAHLSNLPDWLTQPAFDAVMQLLVEKAARPARLVWRHLHVDRPLPRALAGRLAIERTLGAELRGQDRFPFYGVSCAAIRC